METYRPVTTRSREIQAAGVVAFRSGREVLVVHRPKYDDWSFPKGKLERGEHPTAAAVRETEEEAGLRVRLGRPLSGQRYPVRGGHKRVRYWTGRAVDPADDDVSRHVREGEIDQAAWLPAEVALRRLTYRHDRATLREALGVRKKTTTLIVLRHAEARSRRLWHDDDRLRPLLAVGRRQADALEQVLAAYGVRRVATSSSVRCVETVEPYAEASGLSLEATPVLSEEVATRAEVRTLVRGLRHDAEEAGPTAICTHRPVLPLVFDALGLEDPKLEKGEMLVLHLRRGTVRAVERHGV